MLIADANDDPSGISEHLDGAAKPQVFRRTGEGDGPAASLPRERLFECGDRSDRKLGRHEHHRAVLQVRKQHFCLPQHSVDIRTVVLIHGRVVANPHNIGRSGSRNVGAEGEGARGETGLDQLRKARLVKRRLSLRQSGDPLLIEIDRNRGNPSRGGAGGGHRTEMPQAEDRELHGCCSKTQRFWASQSTVRSTPSRMVSFGFQPSARMRRVSSRMNGLSPIHPRSPPA